MMRMYWVLLMVIVGLAAAACSGQTAAPPYTLASESSLPDFVKAEPARVREAYRFALANPHALETVPCYCGCGAMGHMSNLHCYLTAASTVDKPEFDNHAAGCGICVDITLDVMRLMTEGKSPREIRTYVDDRYGAFGPGTDTVYPDA